MACGCGPRPLPSKVGPYGITDLTKRQRGRPLERIEALMGVGAGRGFQLPCSTRARSRSAIWCCARSMRAEVPLDVWGSTTFSLDRPAMTLSGGEAQRIRMGTQIGAGLTACSTWSDEQASACTSRQTTACSPTLVSNFAPGQHPLIVVETTRTRSALAGPSGRHRPGAGVHWRPHRG